MQRHNNNTISIRTYVLASTGILLIGVSLGMLWYWSLDEEEEEENVENVDTEREIEKKKTTEKKENEDEEEKDEEDDLSIESEDDDMFMVKSKTKSLKEQIESSETIENEESMGEKMTYEGLFVKDNPLPTLDSGMAVRDKWLPKNVDQMRTVNNQRAGGIGLLGHEGPAVSGVQTLGNIGKMEKNRVERTWRYYFLKVVDLVCLLLHSYNFYQEYQY